MCHDCGCRLDSKKQLQSSQGLLSSWSVQAAIAGYIQLVLPSDSSFPTTTPLPTSHFLFLSVLQIDFSVALYLCRQGLSH